MCTSPILIRNRKFKYQKSKTRNSFIRVPCGKCDECLQALVRDLYVRARYEYDDCIRSGGICFFCTLTYSDDVVPKLDGFMVFNKQDVINFIKRLRINLERLYQRNFSRSAPVFKYLITSEFGSNPNCSHRPHYHFIPFFKENVSLTLFNKAFEMSLYNRKGKKRIPIFGYIYDLQILDSTNGIRYVAKYVLKDITYDKQRKFIETKIKFYTDYVNNLFYILPFPQNKDDELYNKSIRSSKAYREAIAKYVLPYRHMLQFYMCSNDLGISSIIRKYGEDIINMPCLNFENIPYQFPKLLRQRIEQNYGSKKADVVTKQIFINYVTSAFDSLQLCNKNYLSNKERLELLEFVRLFVQPYNGGLLLVNPSGLSFRNVLEEHSPLVTFEDYLSDCEFFCNNDFFDLRLRLYKLLSLYESDELLKFRASLRRKQVEKNFNDSKQRKLNNPKYLYK